MVRSLVDADTWKKIERLEQERDKAEKQLESERMEMAKNFLDILPVETIAERTKLPVDKVRALQDEYFKNN